MSTLILPHVLLSGCQILQCLGFRTTCNLGGSTEFRGGKDFNVERERKNKFVLGLITVSLYESVNVIIYVARGYQILKLTHNSECSYTDISTTRGVVLIRKEKKIVFDSAYFREMIL